MPHHPHAVDAPGGQGAGDTAGGGRGPHLSRNEEHHKVAGIREGGEEWGGGREVHDHAMSVVHGADHPKEFVFGDAAGAVAAAVSGEYRQATLGFGQGGNQISGGDGTGAKTQVRPPNAASGFAPKQEIHAW